MTEKVVSAGAEGGAASAEQSSDREVRVFISAWVHYYALFLTGSTTLQFTLATRAKCLFF